MISHGAPKPQPKPMEDFLLEKVGKLENNIIAMQRRMAILEQKVKDACKKEV